MINCISLKYFLCLNIQIRNVILINFLIEQLIEMKITLIGLLMKRFIN